MRGVQSNVVDEQRALQRPSRPFVGHFELHTLGVLSVLLHFQVASRSSPLRRKTGRVDRAAQALEPPFQRIVRPHRQVMTPRNSTTTTTADYMKQSRRLMFHSFLRRTRAAQAFRRSRGTLLILNDITENISAWPDYEFKFDQQKVACKSCMVTGTITD